MLGTESLYHQEANGCLIPRTDQHYGQGPPEADIHLRGTLADLSGTRCGVQGQSFLPPPPNADDPSVARGIGPAPFCLFSKSFTSVSILKDLPLTETRRHFLLQRRNLKAYIFKSPFSSCIMKSVLVLAGFAITQALLAASAPVGPSGPCPDVRTCSQRFLSKCQLLTFPLQAMVDAILRGDMDPSACCSYGQCKGDVVVSVGY
ncbi:hypothetical protein CCMA1212_000812 [Trichoderma ghanense]|uniref:Hydrophobin n=1 Tax=Trichoderma ghanense TaxID=65468 RepID=A0ABY2HFV4_9HYPO